jgi:iron complex transport system permease protein
MFEMGAANKQETLTRWLSLVGLSALLLVLLGLSLSIGSVRIPFDTLWEILTGGSEENSVYSRIVLDIRLPKALTAMLAGAALSLAGLQMQTIFRNPLADPFVLGVNAGASLGVALVVMVVGPGSAAILAGMGIGGQFAVVVAATVGAAFVLLFMMLLSTRVDLMTLLIMGLMMGYAISAVVSIVMFFAMPERLQAFFSWTFGSFGAVSWSQFSIFGPALIIGTAMTLISAKMMNAFLLGESYAKSMGVSVVFWRTWCLMSASILTGVVTGFCGPIGFLGVAVPHICRAIFRTSDHRILFPSVIISGAILAVFADFVSQVPGHHVVLPLNAITAILGAPVVVWVLLHRKSMRQAFGG